MTIANIPSNTTTPIVPWMACLTGNSPSWRIVSTNIKVAAEIRSAATPALAASLLALEVAFAARITIDIKPIIGKIPRSISPKFVSASFFKTLIRSRIEKIVNIIPAEPENEPFPPIRVTMAKDINIPMRMTIFSSMLLKLISPSRFKALTSNKTPAENAKIPIILEVI